MEKKQFGAEVDKVLRLMIHSIYTNKEIFLRELISNAADACDKLRYLAVSNPELLATEEPLQITISVNKEQRELIIADNGIGMNKQDLIDNLGTIAHSGTEAFLTQVQDKKDATLIGQFGIGFYSAFMVAESVTVKSTKAGETQSYQWFSEGNNTYEIQELEEVLLHGTQIIVKIKEGEDEFLDQFRIKHIIKNYSDHIAIPIFFIEANDLKQQVNSSLALWTRSKAEITEERYKEFYHNIAHAVDNPWLTLHNKNEGVIEFTNLLFIPENKTFDLFHPDRKCRVKLYIKRVFITDENVEIIPRYLRFLRGIVDCESLPLNISRENLQHNREIEKIRLSITKRVIDALKAKRVEDRAGYEKFWSNFGSVLKEGLCESLIDHTALLEVSLFKSALQRRLITLEEYIANFKPEQNTIYYLSGENEDKLRESPQIEGLLNQGIDVLLFTDHVDDFWNNVVSKFKDYEIKSATTADINLNADNKPTEENESHYKQLCSYFKEVLGNSVQDVQISKKLIQSPSCLVIKEGNMGIRMERFLLEQNQLAQTSAKILEINPDHKIIAKINQDLQAGEQQDELNRKLVKILFAEACLAEGEPIQNVTDFIKTINSMVEELAHLA